MKSIDVFLDEYGDASPATHKEMLAELGVPIGYVPNPAALDADVKRHPLCKPMLGGDVPSVTNPSPQ